MDITTTTANTTQFVSLAPGFTFDPYQAQAVTEARALLQAQGLTVRSFSDDDLVEFELQSIDGLDLAYGPFATVAEALTFAQQNKVAIQNDIRAEIMGEVAA
jgi:hypothetical protein